MALALSAAETTFPRVANTAAGSPLPVGWPPRMAASLQLHVAKRVACPLGS